MTIAPLRPQTSYGAQKAIGELLVSDYSRKGFIDGRALRFPTIVVRPGRPNRAASSWASAILREPLAGHETVCPVAPETAMAILSPRRLVAAVAQLHDLPRECFGSEPSLQLPGVTVTAAEMVAALARAGGGACAARVRWQPDPTIQRIVDGWPRALGAVRAPASASCPTATSTRSSPPSSPMISPHSGRCRGDLQRGDLARARARVTVSHLFRKGNTA